MGEKKTFCMLAGLVFGLGMLMGCQSRHFADSRDDSPAFSHRSAAMDSRRQQRVHERFGDAAGTPYAWWEGRSDRQPYVESGYKTVVHEQVHSRTHDRQHSFHGRVWDSYHQNSRLYRDYGVVK